MQIVDLFYNYARQHLLVQGFIYGPNTYKGAGNEMFPLVWLDDPVYGSLISNDRSNVLSWTANADFLFIPKNESEVPLLQGMALSIAQVFYEKFKSENTGEFRPTGFSFVTLRNYYDFRACGVRATYTFTRRNTVDICNDDFDPDKQFEDMESLPAFSVDGADGCAIFSDKSGLPDFDIKQPDGCDIFEDE